MLSKLTHQTLTERAVESIMAYVEANGLRPGDTLPSQLELASSLGVSRTVIREALNALVGKEIVEVVNGKGAIIKPISSDPLRAFFQKALQFNHETIIELLELRKGVEVQSAHLAAERRTDDQLKQLTETVQQMREHIADAEKNIALDLDLHLQIASAARNSMLLYLVESIRYATKNTILEGRLSRHSGEELERVQVIHEMIIAAIERGDPDAAGKAMEIHFDEAVMAVAKLTYAAEAP